MDANTLEAVKYIGMIAFVIILMIIFRPQKIISFFSLLKLSLVFIESVFENEAKKNFLGKEVKNGQLHRSCEWC